MDKKTWGMAHLALGQAGVGVSIAVSKVLTHGGMSIETIVAGRFLLCVLILGGILAVRLCFSKERKELLVWEYKKSDLGLLFLQALCGGIFFNVLLTWALCHTTATSAGLIASGLPCILALMAMVFLGERLNRNKQIALVLTVAGMALLQVDTVHTEVSTNQTLGNLLVLCALLPESAYTILGKKLGKKCDFLVLAFVLNLVNAVICLPLLSKAHLAELDSALFMQLLWTAFGSIAFYIFWNRGLVVVQASTAALYTAVAPIVTALLAVFLFGEYFSLFDGAALATIIAGIFWGVQPERMGLRSHS